MDMEQEEMQFLGFFGIFAEAFKLLTSRRKIFTKITLSLVVPLSLLALIHTEISNILLNKILVDELTDRTTTKHIVSEYAFLFLFKAIYFSLLLVLSLLSTAAVVYTTAAIYSAKNDTSFSKIMTVVPRVWKRLIVTFLWTFLAFFLYHLTFVIVLGFVFVLFFWSNYSFSVVILFYSLMAIFVIGLVYLSLIWQLASVVSVLEEARGIGAMKKSKELVKGKMLTSFLVFGALFALSFVLQMMFQKLVVKGYGKGLALRGFYGVLCLVVSVSVVLLGLVVQTVLYFVCKSYHHESIDKSALSDHLEVYLGDYVPLTAKDVQLEQYHV